MKVRKKKSVRARDGRVMSPNSLANLSPPWKPGHAPISPGRPRGSGSVVSYLKKRLRGKPISKNRNYETLADEVANIIMKRARRGDYRFLHLILERAESRAVTEDELKAEVERIYLVVRKHVKDQAVMQAIAHDLNRFEEDDV